MRVCWAFFMLLEVFNLSFRTWKSAFCLSTSPKAPCWRFSILAMIMYEQARHCSFGLTKTLVFLLGCNVFSTTQIHKWRWLWKLRLLMKGWSVYDERKRTNYPTWRIGVLFFAILLRLKCKFNLSNYYIVLFVMVFCQMAHSKATQILQESEAMLECMAKLDFFKDATKYFSIYFKEWALYFCCYMLGKHLVFTPFYGMDGFGKVVLLGCS